ncbi:MAG: NAD(P)/FAD-dependent oxidoreductase, partial [Acidimicrobiaceae bacterium]|nr:NAD(P)/FAD-dependent oxidoreductase [Acidimicrobiaceae bacterium]
GLRVAVIGTGASALQFIPHLATDAAHVTVFQRTPPWLIPRPVYHEPLAEGLLELFRLIPGYAHWFRLRLFWCTHEGTVGALRRDPAWDGPLDQAVSRRNEETRRLLTLYLRSQFGDRPDLLEKVVPDYPVGSKRVVLDNGIWASTLKRPNVELVSDGIERVEPAGVRGADGRLHRADVIVFGTGFRASEFLMPMRVAGRGGADLHETWNGDARAYNGVCVPGFPNLFCLYGPNTNIVVNGSIIYFAECATHYVVECLRLLASQGAAAMDCRSDAYDRYAARMDEHNSQMAWGISPVNSWYKSPSGRIAQNWPLPLIDYWRQTRAPSPADFELI